jgi:hypothetical protein
MLKILKDTEMKVLYQRIINLVKVSPQIILLKNII